MKPRTGIVLLGLLACSLGSVLPLAAQTTAPQAPAAAKQQKTSLPRNVLTAVDAGDYVTASENLISYLKGRTISPTDAASLHAAMLLEFIRETDAEVLNAYAAGNKNKRSFLAAFARDPQWQELYLGAGLVPFHTDVGIDVLYRIWSSEKGQVKNKKLATALASVWGGGESDPKPALLKRNPVSNNPVWRYNFFQKRAANGQLHPNYKNLRPWELRFTVAIPDQDWDDRSFAWVANNINVPWDRYDWSCWAAVYTDPSKFGDDVQSGLYGLPYFSQSAAMATHLNGGVCGGMSHLGCFAAMAQGIPAYTAGQPSHCAYAVRTERGKWIGGFGGPDGEMHNHIFGRQAPTSYLLMEKVFGDNAAIDKAYRQSFCARAIEATGDSAAAEKAWNTALASSPLHPFFRHELHRLMTDRGATADEIFSYLQKTIPLYEGNGLSAVDMMGDLDWAIADMNDTQKLALYDALHKIIAGTPSSWATDIKPIFAKQVNTLGQGAPREKYIAHVFESHMNGGDGTTFGKALEWAVAEYVEKGHVDVFSRAFVAAAQASSNSKDAADDKNAEARRKAMLTSYNKAIFAAEQAHSRSAFQMLTKAAEESFGSSAANIPLTTLAEMKGKPAPPTGMFRISTTNEWDKPTSHCDIMTPKGGQSHTSSEAKPNFIVELAKNSTLTGCIIRKSNGSEERMRKATVYTSSDGATWMKKAETEDMPKEWAVKFPGGTTGKWVKIEFDNTPNSNFAHLSHFVVFIK